MKPIHCMIYNIVRKKCKILWMLWLHLHRDKNFVKVTFLLTKLLRRWFHEIFFGEAARVFPQSWKLREFSLTHFWQKFRKSNGLITYNKVKSWFDEIFYWWERISCFSTLWISNHTFFFFCKNFVKVNVLLNKSLKESIWRNIFWYECESREINNTEKFVKLTFYSNIFRVCTF